MQFPREYWQFNYMTVHILNRQSMRILSVLSLILLTAAWSSAQKTRVYTEANALYKTGKKFYDQGLYGQAKDQFQKVLDLQYPAEDPQAKLLVRKAQLLHAQAAVRQELPEGEILVLNFIRSNKPDPIVTEAVMDVGDYYFNSRRYDKAIKFYALMDPSEVSNDVASEIKFKEGVFLFCTKGVRSSYPGFSAVKDLRNTHYYPTNYYLAMSYFFTERYPLAIEHFTKIEKSQRYRSQIPFYVCQIHFCRSPVCRTHHLW